MSANNRQLTNELLAKILDVLEASRQVDVPSDYCFDTFMAVPASTPVTRRVVLPTPGCYLSFTAASGLLPELSVQNQNGTVIARVPGATHAHVTFQTGSFVDLSVTAMGGGADSSVIIWVSTRPLTMAAI